MNQAVENGRKKRNIGSLLLAVGLLVSVLAALVIAATLLRQQQPQATQPSTATPTQTTPTQTDPTQPPEIDGLTVTSPILTNFVWFQQNLTFSGTANPREPLTIGGKTVEIQENGSFSVEIPLQSGANEIPVTYLGQTVVYHVEHRYVLKSITPELGGSYGSGSILQLSATVRAGTSLTVIFRGEAVPMEPSGDEQDGFIQYTGSYVLPGGNLEDLELGTVIFDGVCDGIRETRTSGPIICQKRTDVLKSDPSVTPEGGDYVDVGSGYIVEVLNNSAETFLGDDVTTDFSRPDLSYLPKGTVDYGYVEDIENETFTIRLRCGRRIYYSKKNYPPITYPVVVKTYIGTLPDHNELALAQWEQDRDHTVLVLDTMWKAPFYLELLPQRYSDPQNNIFQISSFTAEYVEITFCYATKFSGEVTIPQDNLLFSRATLTQNKNDATLRLYLKEKGRFFGWDSYYNEAGQLCFRFTNPKSVSTTDANAYGVDLSGIKILVDVGHGGGDPGAMAGSLTEADLNLQLAQKLKRELETMGATVIINRTDDASLTVQQRIALLKETAPDLCLSVHQNSGTDPNFTGGWICYYTPFSKYATEVILRETANAGIYSKTVLTWIKNYMSRETVCPVVLLENGFMSNTADLAGIVDENTQLRKAKAIAKGVARYFLAISE